MEELREQLCLLDRSLNWLLVIIAGVLLSFWATARQRDALCLTLAGEDSCAEQLGNVLPIRRLVAILVMLALTFFFLLSLCVEAQAECQGDSAAVRSARLNRWAALFVLAAAVIRFIDINELCRQAWEDSCE